MWDKELLAIKVVELEALVVVLEVVVVDNSVLEEIESGSMEEQLSLE